MSTRGRSTQYPVRMERLTLGRMQNPIRGLLHGGAALASLVGLVLLLSRARGSIVAIIGAAIFGVALLVMYSVSSLYHSVPWSVTWKTRLQRLDHSMIYLVVAGTFTPIALASLHGTTLVAGLGLIWGLAITGILLKMLHPSVKTWLSVTLQMVMGWLAVMFLPSMVVALGFDAVALIVVGGLCYTAGVIIFTTKRPKLFPRAFSYHELFHVLVVTASVFHFLAVFSYAIPATV